MPLKASGDAVMPLPVVWTIEQAKTVIDVVIITMKTEEASAALRRFPPTFQAFGQLQYNIAECRDAEGLLHYVAVIRTAEQSDGPAQAAASAALREVAPQVLVLLGIAGGKPELGFTLGDVVVANRMHDFSVKAQKPNGDITYAHHGAPAHKSAQRLASNLAADVQRYGDWNTSQAIGIERPPVNLARKNFYGTPDWQKDVRASLSVYFGANPRRTQPIVFDGPVGSASLLLKNAETMHQWLEMARDMKAVDMEITGVFEATRLFENDVPIVVVRGLSDVIGFKRDERWTEYACHTSASFCKAMLVANTLRLVPKNASTLLAASLGKSVLEKGEHKLKHLARPILSPASRSNFVRLGANNHRDDASFSFSLILTILWPGKPFILMGFVAVYSDADGCYCWNKESTLQIGGRVVETSGNYFDLQTPETVNSGIVQIAYGRKVQPPLKIQAPVDCDYGDVSICIKIMIDDDIREEEYFFRFEVGGDLIPMDRIREPPLLSNTRLEEMRNARIITQQEFERAFEIRDTNRFQVVKYGEYIRHVYCEGKGLIPVTLDLVNFLKDLVRRSRGDEE